MKLKLILQIVFAFLIVAFGYLSYQSIMKPIEFAKIKDERYKKIVTQLINIRKAQNAYKDANRTYTASFDTLIAFIKTDSIPIVMAIGSLTDEQIEAGMTEQEAVRKGFITRDTTKVSALEKTFGKGFNADNLRYIHGTDKKEFKMGTALVYTGGNSQVEVFEAKASNTVIFADIRDQFLDEIKEENGNRLRINKYPGLKVGSLEEANNGTGNWE